MDLQLQNPVRFIPRNYTYKSLTGQTIEGIVSRDGLEAFTIVSVTFVQYVRYVDGTEKFSSDINYELFACFLVILKILPNNPVQWP